MTTFYGFTATQTYTYDSLNRIKDAKEMIGTTEQWKQTFTYDRYGNRRFDEANTTTIAKNCTNGSYNIVCAADVAAVNPTVDAATNKLVGYTFDNSGNTKVDATGRQFTYDAENKQTEVKDSNNVTIGKYYYDGDGKRVKKVAGNETTIFIYDALGKLVAEYSNQTPQNPQVSYLTSDHLGSPRINTDASGQVTARHDYQPFGEEIQRASYGNDDVRKQFTSYERDSETDLDFAQARMFGNNLGRFTSPDPAMVSASIQNPQTWNRYIYVLNNPLKYSDPLGLWEITGADIEYGTREKKGKDGKIITERYVKSVKIILKKEKGDDLKSLAKQLNIKEKDAQKYFDAADADGNIQLSTVNNTIGKLFGKVEDRIRDHEQAKLENPANKDDQGWDCSRTCSSLAGNETIGTEGIDAQVQSGIARNVEQKNLKTGDMVRFIKPGSPEKSAHWATFLMFNKSGEPFVFSKSGIKGRNEFGTIDDIRRDRTSVYGPVQAAPGRGTTGFYRY